jgi:hypothetical protein
LLCNKKLNTPNGFGDKCVDFGGFMPFVRWGMATVASSHFATIENEHMEAPKLYGDDK